MEIRKITREEERNRVIHETAYQYRDWAVEIPYLEFPSNTKVSVIPPFGGTIARFCILPKDSKVDPKEDYGISVYLDAYDQLGYVQEPYWEIYPNEDEDTSRFLIDETDDLMEAIEKALVVKYGWSKEKIHSTSIDESKKKYHQLRKQSIRLVEDASEIIEDLKYRIENYEEHIK